MIINVAAVIVTYSRPDELKLVVQSLLSQSVAPKHILVIDNASPRPAREVLESYPTVEVIRSEENTGGAGGFSRGLEEALLRGVDWVWLMDDDAIPMQGSMEALVNVNAKLPDDIGALCSAVYEYGGIALSHRRRFNRKWGFEKKLSESNYLSPIEIDTGSFVGFFVRAKAALQIGLPDPNFFLAYDDTEYSLRLKRNGWKLWLVPSSKIEHLRPQGSRLRHGAFSQKHFYNVRNRIHVLKTYCDWRFLGTFWGIFIGFLLWFYSEKFWQLPHIKLFVRAIRDGYKGKLGKI